LTGDSLDLADGATEATAELSQQVLQHVSQRDHDEHNCRDADNKTQDYAAYDDEILWT
jgi:ribose 5-phosphate isomerase RpiB